MNRLCVVTAPPYTNTPQMDGNIAVNITIVVIFHITLTSHGALVNLQGRSNHLVGLQQNTNTHIQCNLVLKKIYCILSQQSHVVEVPTLFLFQTVTGKLTSNSLLENWPITALICNKCVYSTVNLIQLSNVMSIELLLTATVHSSPKQMHNFLLFDKNYSDQLLNEITEPFFKMSSVGTNGLSHRHEVKEH